MRELKSPRVIFLPASYNQWLVKDMCKSRLLLKDTLMPVFHEKLFFNCVRAEFLQELFVKL